MAEEQQVIYGIAFEGKAEGLVQAAQQASTSLGDLSKVIEAIQAQTAAIQQSFGKVEGALDGLTKSSEKVEAALGAVAKNTEKVDKGSKKAGDAVQGAGKNARKAEVAFSGFGRGLVSSTLHIGGLITPSRLLGAALGTALVVSVQRGMAAMAEYNDELERLETSTSGALAASGAEAVKKMSLQTGTPDAAIQSVFNEMVRLDTFNEKHWDDYAQFVPQFATELHNAGIEAGSFTRKLISMAKSVKWPDNDIGGFARDFAGAAHQIGVPLDMLANEISSDSLQAFQNFGYVLENGQVDLEKYMATVAGLTRAGFSVKTFTLAMDNLLYELSSGDARLAQQRWDALMGTIATGNRTEALALLNELGVKEKAAENFIRAVQMGLFDPEDFKDAGGYIKDEFEYLASASVESLDEFFSVVGKRYSEGWRNVLAYTLAPIMGQLTGKSPEEWLKSQGIEPVGNLPAGLGDTILDMTDRNLGLKQGGKKNTGGTGQGQPAPLSPSGLTKEQEALRGKIGVIKSFVLPNFNIGESVDNLINSTYEKAQEVFDIWWFDILDEAGRGQYSKDYSWKKDITARDIVNTVIQYLETQYQSLPSAPPQGTSPQSAIPTGVQYASFGTYDVTPYYIDVVEAAEDANDKIIVDAQRTAKTQTGLNNLVANSGTDAYQQISRSAERAMAYQTYLAIQSSYKQAGAFGVFREAMQLVGVDIDGVTEKLSEWGISAPTLFDKFLQGAERVGKEWLDKMGLTENFNKAKKIVSEFVDYMEGVGLNVSAIWQLIVEGNAQTLKEIGDEAIGQLKKIAGTLIMDIAEIWATGGGDWSKIWKKVWKSLLGTALSAMIKLITSTEAMAGIISGLMGLIKGLTEGWAAAIAYGAVAIGIIGSAALLINEFKKDAEEAQKDDKTDENFASPSSARLSSLGPAVMPVSTLPPTSGGSTQVVNVTLPNAQIYGKIDDDTARKFGEGLASSLSFRGVAPLAYS